MTVLGIRCNLSFEKSIYRFAKQLQQITSGFELFNCCLLSVEKTFSISHKHTRLSKQNIITLASNVLVDSLSISYIKYNSEWIDKYSDLLSRQTNNYCIKHIYIQYLGTR